jgi:uncharacterized membrane protein (DUF106 family)
MWVFNSAFGKIFDVLFLPFRSLSPWVAMILVSILTGLLMLFVFKWTSNQKGIQKVKNKIKAHLLELRLYKDNLSLSLRAQGNILRCNLRYIGYSAKPMLVMIIPLVLILIQLNFWFGYESLSPNEPSILKIKLKENQNPLETPVEIEPSSALVMDDFPLRIEETHEIDWRFYAKEAGVYQLSMTIDGKTVTKKISVAQKALSKISPIKPGKGFFKQAMYPTESPFDGNLPVQEIEVGYPTKNMSLFGWGIHWLIAYFILSIIFGFAFKGIFNVEI